MKFLLYSINYSPELTGIGKYNGDMVSEISGHDVETHVITAPAYYPEWKLHEGFKNWWSTEQAGGVSVYRCPLYIPKFPTAFKRILHLISFAKSSGFRLLSLFKLKPDVVFLVQPTLFCAPAALIYCKLTGAKSILHIQDFEVDAMFGVSIKRRSKKPESGVKKFAHFIESWLMQRFDMVSSISYKMLDNARSKGVADNKLLFFPNWADTDFVTPEVSGDNLRAKWGYKEDDKIVLYSGNIGKKQGLEIIINAAPHFKDEKNVKFLIIGNGSYCDDFIKVAKDLELNNIQFMPLQPWELVPEILAMADVHLVVQKRGAADAVLPSKLTNILSAGGHALVTADTDTELGEIAIKHPGIYKCVEPENVNTFVDGLKYCLEQDTKTVNNVARDYAVENLNKSKVISRFVEDIKKLI